MGGDRNVKRRRQAEIAQNPAKNKSSLRYSKSTVFKKDEDVKDGTGSIESKKVHTTTSNNQWDSTLANNLASSSSSHVHHQFSKRKHMRHLSNISTHDVKRRVYRRSNGSMQSRGSLGSAGKAIAERTPRNLA